MSKLILITGAGGFIGSAFVRRTLQTTDYRLRAFVRKTDDLRLQRRLTDHRPVQDALKEGRLQIINGDLTGDISGLCEGVDFVVHAAAKTFVDHSIKDPCPFFESNTLGTLRLLEESRRQKVARYIQVSTDEVYGSILQGAYDEHSPIDPTNPYSASKAAADAWVQAYAPTFGLHTCITRTENNYGPFQHPQKLIPVAVKALMQGQKIPIYGDGMHVRQWLWVADHVDALLLLLSKDYEPGSIFHVAGQEEIPNIHLAFQIIEAMVGRKNMPEIEMLKYIRLVDDTEVRPGHDRRYALMSDKIKELGWKPQVPLSVGLTQLVQWHKQSPQWLGLNPVPISK